MIDIQLRIQLAQKKTLRDPHQNNALLKNYHPCISPKGWENKWSCLAWHCPNMVLRFVILRRLLAWSHLNGSERGICQLESAYLKKLLTMVIYGDLATWINMQWSDSKDLSPLVVSESNLPARHFFHQVKWQEITKSPPSSFPNFSLSEIWIHLIRQSWLINPLSKPLFHTFSGEELWSLHRITRCKA